MRTKTITLYSFAELKPQAQARALAEWQQHAGSDLDYSCIYDDAATIARFMGLDIRQQRVKLRDGSTRMDPAIYWSGFWSQGDGACFEGEWRARDVQPGKVREHAPQDAELHRIADIFERIAPTYPEASFTVKHRGHYHHEMCTAFEFEAGDPPGELSEEDAETHYATFPEEALKEAARDLMRWIYKSLETEYEYQTSEEVGREMLASEGEVFTAEGDRE